MFSFDAPITMGDASAGLAACVRAIDAGESEISLSQLAHSDSSGVAVLIAANRHAQLKGKTLRVSAAPASVRSLATLYGVEAMMGLDAQQSITADHIA